MSALPKLYLVEVENEIQLTDISEVLVQNLDEGLH